MNESSSLYLRLRVRIAEKESVNKMSLHNLATVFGPTLLRPAEKDSKIPTNPTQPITMGDSWSLEVMSQVLLHIFRCSLKKNWLVSRTFAGHTPEYFSDALYTFHFCLDYSSRVTHDTTRACFCIRYKSCCTSSSWRLFPLRTARDRASCFPPRCRTKHAEDELQ